MGLTPEMQRMIETGKLVPLTVLELPNGARWEGRLPTAVSTYMRGMSDEIARLRAENEVYLARITKLNGELYDAHNVIDTYKNDPTKALREIGYHDVEGFYSMEGKDEPE